MSSQVVTIYSATGVPHVGRLEFSEPRLSRVESFPGLDFACTGLLALNGDEWLVELDMIEPYRADMLGFFEEIADRAEGGWQGMKSWHSQDYEMSIDATNDGKGLTMLRILIRWMRPVGDEDERYGILAVASADMPRVAAEMHRFLQQRLPSSGS